MNIASVQWKDCMYIQMSCSRAFSNLYTLALHSSCGLPLPKWYMVVNFSTSGSFKKIRSGLPSQLFFRSRGKKRGCGKSCEGRPGYEAKEKRDERASGDEPVAIAKAM